MSCESLVEDVISIPFPNYEFNKKNSVNREYPNKSVRYGWKIYLESVDSQIESDDKLSSQDTENYLDRRNSVGEKIENISLPAIEHTWRLSKGSSEDNIQQNYQYTSREPTITTRETLNGEEHSQFDVQQRRFKLAKIVPTLAKQIKEENKNMLEERNTSQIQENIIDHLTGFIEHLALPAILGVEKLHKKFHRESMKARQQIEFLKRENSLIEAQIEATNKANRVVDKKFLRPRLRMSHNKLQNNNNERTGRSDLFRNGNRRMDLQKMVRNIEKTLLALKDEDDTEKERLMKAALILYDKVKETELGQNPTEIKNPSYKRNILKKQKQLEKDISRSKHGTFNAKKGKEIPIEFDDVGNMYIPEIIPVSTKGKSEKAQKEIPNEFDVGSTYSPEIIRVSTKGTRFFQDPKPLINVQSLNLDTNNSFMAQANLNKRAYVYGVTIKTKNRCHPVIDTREKAFSRRDLRLEKEQRCGRKFQSFAQLYNCRQSTNRLCDGTISVML